jgi:hypothetical protein
MKFRRILICAVVAQLLAFPLAPSASAISISIGSATDATTTSLTGGGSGDRAAAFSLGTVDPGESVPDALFASVDARTRYVSNAAADRGITFSGGTAQAQINSDYTVVFSINPDSLATTYEVVVDTSILGELTLLDDIAGTQSTAAVVSDVVGRLGGTVTSGLGIAGIAQSFSVGTGTNLAEERNIAGSNSINLGSFSGPQSFTLRFTFSTRASAPQSALGADEAAARFGASGPLSGATADDYPGPGDVVDRDQSLDGHFVTVKATVLAVPEPGTLALLGIGIVGVVAMRRRRK